MESVPMDVLNAYLVPYLGILDQVALSGVSKRYHARFSAVSTEWGNLLLNHRLEYAAANGDLDLLEHCAPRKS